ncbi:hypothetical protein [Hahella ganghwensis]|uniref:DUF7919 family protein n=1 Tax=Hahella ganghwensis TaxID=286420 RepID=UPI00037DA884|nr:hypothetical protein [Hahella ganghwensis]
MLYKDLTQYTDGFEPSLERVFNIGWLDSNSDFPVGNVKPEHLHKLKELALGKHPFSACFRISRGFASCGLCGGITTTIFHEKKEIIGTFLLLVPSLDDGQYFAAPSTIIHFIEKHQYMPPQAFIDSLERLDLQEGFNAENVIREMMES